MVPFSSSNKSSFHKVKFDENYNLKRCFVDCVTRNSLFRNGYLACDQNLPRSNFLAGLKIAMEGNYDFHCTRLSKMQRPIILQEMFDAMVFPFFHRIAKGAKQNNFVPLVPASRDSYNMPKLREFVHYKTKHYFT